MSHDDKKPSQDQRWSDHLRDEARVLEGQQRAAGDSHAPTSRVQPFTQQNMSDEVLRAIQGERARCEAIARAWAEPGRLAAGYPALDEPHRALLCDLAAAISREIASGEEAS